MLGVLRSARARVHATGAGIARWAYSFESTTCRAVIFHHGRSGSSVLGGQLHQHPRIDYDFEIFNPGVQALRDEQDEAGSVEEFLRRRVEAASRRCYVFEMKPFLAEVQETEVVNMEVPEILEVFGRLGVDRFVLLERRNFIRRKVSALFGHKTEVWQLTPMSADPGPKGTVVLPFESPEGLLEEIDAYRREFDDIADELPPDRLLRLSYEEDLRDDPSLGYARVCRFLGVKPGRPRLTRRRINPERLVDLVENYDALESALIGTHHRWMLDE
jgi:LPS sulfotransferase NodH